MNRAGWAAQLKGRADADRSRRSARAGSTIRAALVDPARGFRAIVDVPSALPYAAAALGGAGLMATWLKLGGLFGRRTVGRADAEWGFLVAVLVLGAAVAVVAQLAWGAVAGRVLGGGATPAGLRAVWGAALLPVALSLAVLVPLDLLFVGPATFATDPLQGAVETTWAAISLALATAAVVWWLIGLARGSRAVTGAGPARVAAAIVLGGTILGAIVAGLRLGLAALAEAA